MENLPPNHQVYSSIDYFSSTKLTKSTVTSIMPAITSFTRISTMEKSGDYDPCEESWRTFNSKWYKEVMNITYVDQEPGEGDLPTSYLTAIDVYETTEPHGPGELYKTCDGITRFRPLGPPTSILTRLVTRTKHRPVADVSGMWTTINDPSTLGLVPPSCTFEGSLPSCGYMPGSTMGKTRVGSTNGVQACTES
jgi:hypothetical protein